MIEVNNLSLRAGAFALNGISFTVPRGAYSVLMGRTGCGKTSLLEAICGLKTTASGRISLLGRDVTALKPAERGIGLVPQDGALFSTMTVREHLAFALTIRNWRRAEIKTRVGELAELLGLERLLDRRPQGLSGGEVQRVALGRALACRPGILCLDEPLSALDEETRGEMYGVLRAVREHTGVTALHVTHNRAEACALGNCCFFLRDGTIVEATASELAEGSSLVSGGNRV
jgi:ABC-type sugar transport system ATPase subunit